MDKPTEATGTRKRQQIRTANKTVFIWIIVASIVVGICGVASQFLIRELIFKNKIYSALTDTNRTLKKNAQSYEGLKTEVNKLIADNNLAMLKKGENSTALQVVIDALPTEDNRPALASSMQTEVLGPAGVKIDSFSVIDAGSPAAATSADAGTATPFDFSFVIIGNYDQILQAMSNMERSIRPISVKTIDLQGSGGSFRANITATTYYQPAASISLGERTVQP